jgi:hypothetical protein
MMLMNKEKIGPQHLGREAKVYVRQSTLNQVRHNHESRRRQYELEERARAWGGLKWKSSMRISANRLRGAQSAQDLSRPTRFGTLDK